LTKEERQIMIAELVSQGHGRPTILEMVDGTTEWEVRKTIKAIKNGTLEVPGLSAETKKSANKNVRKTAVEIISDLRPLNLKVPSPPKVNKKKNDLLTVAFVGDTHGQFVDEKAFGVACEIISDVNPDILVHLGDLGDFYSVSRFDKNPNRKMVLQEDLKHAGRLLGMLNQTVSEDTRKVLVEGNHENRLDRYITHNAPALAGLPHLKMERLLDLDNLGWEYVTHDLELVDNFLIKHGNSVRSKAAYTAKAEMEAAWMSGVSGHTHRAAVYSYTPRKSFLSKKRSPIWIENGCLCQMEAEYIKGNANWQQAFSIVRFDKYGAIPEVVYILNGMAVYNGKTYRG